MEECDWLLGNKFFIYIDRELTVVCGINIKNWGQYPKATEK